MTEPTKRVQAYRNERIIVHFDPNICIHSGHCVRSLPSVFDLSKLRWINVDGADVGEIIKTVKACPSGALSVERVRRMGDT